MVSPIRPGDQPELGHSRPRYDKLDNISVKIFVVFPVVEGAAWHLIGCPGTEFLHL